MPAAQSSTPTTQQLIILVDTIVEHSWFSPYTNTWFDYVCLRDLYESEGYQFVARLPVSWHITAMCFFSIFRI